MKNWLFCFYKTFKDWFRCISFLMNLPQQHICGPVFSIRPQMEQDMNVGRSGPKPQLWKEMSEYLHVTCIIEPVCIQRSWLHKGIGHSCLQGSLRNSLLLQLGQPRADNRYLPCKPLDLDFLSPERPSLAWEKPTGCEECCPTSVTDSAHLQGLPWRLLHIKQFIDS